MLSFHSLKNRLARGNTEIRLLLFAGYETKQTSGSRRTDVHLLVLVCKSPFFRNVERPRTGCVTTLIHSSNKAVSGDISRRLVSFSILEVGILLGPQLVYKPIVRQFDISTGDSTIFGDITS